MNQKDTVIQVLIGKREEVGEVVRTGLKAMDKSTGGMRPGNTYLLAGLEKSGKTTLLLNWISYNIARDIKVCFVSTEMSLREITERLAVIRNLRLGEVSPEMRNLSQQIHDSLIFISVDDLIVSGGISVTKTAELVEKAIWSDAKLFVVDNLTTFGSQQTGTDATWMKVAVAITKLVNLAKTNKVVGIIVLHIKPETVYRESPTGIKDMVKSGSPERIFEESVTVVNRPSLGNVYGGGASLSQVSGAFLLWRPFQKFEAELLQSHTALILDSMRHSKSGVVIRLSYKAETGKFDELITENDVHDLFQK